jgi:hypothetical protein
MKKMHSIMKPLPSSETNDSGRPERTIRPLDRFNRDKFYAPSYQEQKAISAMAAGKGQEAIDWYDRAILDDPERGHRIITQACQYDFAPCKSAYYLFCLNLSNVDRMKADYKLGLLGVCFRAYRADEKAEQYSNVLMGRVHLWDNPPPQCPSTSTTSVATDQTKLKNQY